MKRSLKFVLCLMATLGSMDADDGVKSPVKRALPYLEEEGTWWVDDKKCVSCHHTTFFVWPKDLALQSGSDVNKETLDEQREWVWKSLLEDRTEDPENPDSKVIAGEKVGDKNVEALSQMLISASAPAVPADAKKQFLEIIVKRQNDDGNWSPNGQLPLQQRPKTETQWASNLWNPIAIGIEGGDMKTATDPGKSDAAKTSEWFAMNAISKNDAESIAMLLKRQNEDGGWSWMDGEPSDPTGTGQALFALARTGKVEENTDAVGRARDYLLKTQVEDGHWETKSTKKREKSTRISDFWGSAWAVIGLLEAESRL